MHIFKIIWVGIAKLPSGNIALPVLSLQTFFSHGWCDLLSTLDGILRDEKFHLKNASYNETLVPAEIKLLNIN